MINILPKSCIIIILFIEKCVESIAKVIDP